MTIFIFHEIYESLYSYSYYVTNAYECEYVICEIEWTGGDSDKHKCHKAEEGHLPTYLMMDGAQLAGDVEVWRGVRTGKYVITVTRTHNT